MKQEQGTSKLLNKNFIKLVIGMEFYLIAYALLLFALGFSFMTAGAALGNWMYGRLLGRFIETPGIALLILAGVTALVALFGKVTATSPQKTEI